MSLSFLVNALPVRNAVYSQWNLIGVINFCSEVALSRLTLALSGLNTRY